MKKIDAYRQQRKEETGKTLFRVSAVKELLETALEGVEPVSTTQERLTALEERVERIEAFYTDSRKANL